MPADITCSKMRTVFQERSSGKTLSFEEQIMSKDKYLSLFLAQMEGIVFVILQIPFTSWAVRKLGNIVGYSTVFAGGCLVM